MGVIRLVPDLTRLATTSVWTRHFSLTATRANKKGLLLGVYSKTKEDGEGVILSSAAKNYAIAHKTNFNELLQSAGPNIKLGRSRLFYGLDKEFSCVALVGLGPEDAGVNDAEDIDESRENVRLAVSEGVRQLREVGCSSVEVDPCRHSEAAAEGSALALFSYDDLKKEGSRKLKVDLKLHGSEGSQEDWQSGLAKASGQNLARMLMEMPANILTPSAFAQIVLDTCAVSNVHFNVRGKQWIVDQKMGAFLSVAKGSVEPPVFLEMVYSGGSSPQDKPVVLVGKGITFDSGGISLKKPLHMDMMRGDMGGGACVVGALHAASQLQLPINIVGLVPLCENMPSGGANKPGDVVTAMNGTTIQVDDTDYEGRLILADALCYAHRFNPLVILDMATLTGEMMIALSGATCGAFSNSPLMWRHLFKAGVRSGDRMWRMPLYKFYSREIKAAPLADLNNFVGPLGGACVAATFLKEFVTASHWIHLDIAGVMNSAKEEGYTTKGMTGRPTRTVVEFISRLAKLPPQTSN